MSENTTLITKDIMELLQENIATDEQYFYAKSDYWHYGWTGTPHRVSIIAELAAKHYPGDIAEIGCAKGVTMVGLAKVASDHDRRVIAIDPWQRDLKDGHSLDFETFTKGTESYTDIIDVLRMKSQDEAAIRYLKAAPLCFAYIDGEHNYDALASDIGAVFHAAVIAVDDILWDWRLLRAFRDEAKDRQKIRHPFCNEGYIL